MAKSNLRRISRLRRKKHIRKRVYGTAERPRLCVFRSARHIYVQVIDDDAGKTLASASSMVLGDGCDGRNRDGAALVGARIAVLASEVGIAQVVFDRGGYLYHGRVAALADAARDGGLKF